MALKVRGIRADLDLHCQKGGLTTPGPHRIAATDKIKLVSVIHAVAIKFTNILIIIQ